MTDYLCNDIFSRIGEEIQKIKDTKLNKEKFNIVMREIYGISVRGEDCLEEIMMVIQDYPIFEKTEYPDIFICDDGMSDEVLYTKDLIITYNTIADCINNINGYEEWGLRTNTAEY